MTSEKHNQTGIPAERGLGRRSWLKRVAWTGGAGYALLAEGEPVQAAGRSASEPGPAIVVASDGKAVTETVYGKVRGYFRNGVVTFKGIPYGGQTGGSSRFMPPVKAQPWAGVRSSLYYGPVSPQGSPRWLVSRRECLHVRVG